MRFKLHAMFSIALLGAAAAHIADAAMININFTGTPYTGTAETSPATPTAAAGVWNDFTSAADWESDTKSVLFSDGSSGPTLTVDTTGASSANWNSGGVALQTRNFSTVGGVYDVANLYETGLANSSNGRPTGFRLKGLAPGNYEVFVVPMYRSLIQAGIKQDAGARFLIGLGNDTDARDAGDLTLSSTAANPTQHLDTTLTSWVAATDGTTAYNYVGANVTIDSANRWLTFLFEATTTGNGDRPGPGVIQIRSIDVPEPASILMASLLVVSSMVRRPAYFTRTFDV